MHFGQESYKYNGSEGKRRHLQFYHIIILVFCPVPYLLPSLLPLNTKQEQISSILGAELKKAIHHVL